MEYISLLTLNRHIKQLLSGGFPEAIWITAEITELQNHSSGHCYLQLAEKREDDESILASARATIWASTYRMIKSYFESTTGRALSKGMKILVKVEIVFHEVYGYSLNIKDIDPTFTLGDIERRRREIIDRLICEGIIDKNRELEFPLLPKRVAIISSSTAAGYEDFVHQLEQNKDHYSFILTLFPTIMQGDKTAESVLHSLELIERQKNDFDVIVIIRGGGAQQDLAAFDNYDIAAAIATFPLPVIAGIGHERDETIVDRVAYLRVKTPTAAATFLIDAFSEQEQYIDHCIQWLNDFSIDFFKENRLLQTDYSNHCHQVVSKVLMTVTTRLSLLSQDISHLSIKLLNNQNNKLSLFGETLDLKIEKGVMLQTAIMDRNLERLKYSLQEYFTRQYRLLDVVETTRRLSDPEHILKKGYSVTRINGNALKDVSAITVGDIIETQLFHGQLKSIIKEKIEESN